MNRLFASLLLGSVLVFPLAATAQGITGGQTGGGTTGGQTDGGTTGGSGGGRLTNPLKSDSLEQLLLDILDFVKIIGGIVIMIMLVLVGFKFVAAQGNEEKIREARAMLLWTVIGALILLGASAIQAGISATVENL